MNNVFLTFSLAGQWIVQSTNYSLLLNPGYENLFVGQVQWRYLKKHKSCLESIKQNLDKCHKINDIVVYRIKSVQSQIHSIHYIVFIHRESCIKSLIKLDQDFTFLNQFMIQSQSYNCLTIASFHDGIAIIEKIHFLNPNLKLIKSSVHKLNKYIGTFFSSEIRIS